MKRVLAMMTVIALLGVVGVVGCGGGGGGGGNQNPAITSLTSAAGALWPGAATNVTCVATDANGDTLTYGWTATGGTFTGAGATVSWNAPAGGGSYTITCKVSDGAGGTASRTVEVAVGAMVTGTAVALNGGAAVEGVEIEIGGRVGVSDATGNFTIAGVGQGTHQVMTGATSPYTVAGVIMVTMNQAGTTVEIAQNVPVFSGPPPPPF